MTEPNDSDEMWGKYEELAQAIKAYGVACVMEIVSHPENTQAIFDSLNQAEIGALAKVPPEMPLLASYLADEMKHVRELIRIAVSIKQEEVA
jgi:hypothetical protein